MQRSLTVFLEGCKSEHTKKQYQYYLDRFKDHYKLKDYDSMLAIEPTQIQIMIEDYVMDLKKKVSPNTVPTMIFGIKSFYEANDIELKWKKIQKLLPERKKVSGGKAYTKDQIRLLLRLADDVRSRALILFLASSGVRIGALSDMKLKHLADYENCKLVTVYEGTIDEYKTFISPECVKALDQYLNKRKQNGEYITENTPIFRTVFNIKYQKVIAAKRATLQEIIRRLLIKAGFRSGHENKRYDVQIDHGFRKFFNTAIKETEGINLSYAEKLMGHSVTIPLDNNYLDGAESKIFKEYQKALPNITIDDLEVERTKRIKAEQEKTEIQELKSQMAFLMDIWKKGFMPMEEKKQE